MPCPAEEQRRLCNVGSCNPSCVLADWSPWGSCSRACRFNSEAAAGRRERIRAIAKPPQGSGICPDEQGPLRLQEEKCNEEVCSINASCHGSDQVFVLLDGSDAANYAAQLALMRGIVGNASADMQFGVAAYGGQVQVLSKMTGDRQELLEALQAPAAPGGSPDLAKAEAFAFNLVQTTRGGTFHAMQGSSSVETVLVFADAGLSLLDPAIAQAKRLRALGVRVLFAVVEDGAAATRNGACKLAGEPCVANLEAAPHWQELTASPLRFLAALCASLPGPPTAPPSVFAPEGIK